MGKELVEALTTLSTGNLGPAIYPHFGAGHCCPRIPGTTLVYMLKFDAPEDPALAALLIDQNGVASIRQLQANGVSEHIVRSRIAIGRWQRIYEGVYALFSGPLPRSTRVWAAIVRCGPGAAASHETAAELAGLCLQVDDRVHVTVDARRRVRVADKGVVIHYAHRLPSTRHPAKSPPQTRLDDTVLDLVDVSRSAAAAAGWVLAAIQRRLTTPSRLGAALSMRKKIKWRRMCEAMLLHAVNGAHSILEVDHLRRVERAHGLPAGHRQRRVAGERVIWIDVDHDEFATRVELDGRVGHIGEGVFRDRRRDNRATVGQRATLRYGYHDVFGDPCGVAAEEAVVLQDRGWVGTPKKCGTNCPIAEAMAMIRNRAA